MTSSAPKVPGTPGCPFHAGAAPTASLTRRPAADDALEPVPTFNGVRDVLKDPELKQAGFLAGLVQQSAGQQGHAPVLYLQGDEHTEMRRATAKYFTPTAVNAYQPMIARLADDLIGEFVRKGEVNLDDLSLKLAVTVAAQVIGLNASRLPGMEKRIEAFVTGDVDGAPGAAMKSSPLRQARMGTNVALFFTLDVKPAIEARRKSAQDDLISYLLEREYSDQDILTECITYATAGMITTREFITLAAYQMLRHPELRAEYLHSTEKERHAILHEILRLDPVVGTLYRRAEQDVEVEGRHYPSGTTFALNVQTANVDPGIVGEDAEQLCPHRPLPRGVQAQGLSFGDGPHRCPGAFLAIKESDVFLRRLLIWRDLEIVRDPDIGYNELVKGYELRGLRVRLGQGRAGQA
ncbi:cytochrome P450 [Deinococcus cavernae]|uniref:Cytochrome P450 n=1 Tax=Deinococcus cavernae TaxID=2320857 RepID=A0A418VGJ3_9DEIO|nr:cytochrome P450 [Deinococcus cavernae]RJF75209.1 cytochrome P450 [Deinococcus cavernae]